MKTLILALGLLAAQIALAQDYSFVNLRVRVEDKVTPIERFSKDMEQDFVSRIKSTLYSRILSEYPELKSLPNDRFGEIFTFDIDLNWWSDAESMGGASIAVFVKDGAGYFSQHPIRITRKSPVEFLEENIAIGTWNVKPLGMINSSNHSLPAILGNTVMGSDLPVEVFEQLAWEAVSKASFNRQLPPNQLRHEILVRLPELEMFLGGLTEKLRLVLQNPKAFEAELTKKAGEIEKKLTELYTKHEITKNEANERVRKLHEDVSELEARAQSARVAAEQAYRSHQQLKPVMEAILKGSTRGEFEVRKHAHNLELAGSLAAETNAAINGILNQNLFQMLQMKGTDWKSIHSALSIEPTILNVETIPGEKGLFSREAETYKIQVGVVATGKTHSHGDSHHATLTFLHQKGVTSLDPSGHADVSGFFNDIERMMDDLVLKEKTTPAGSFIAQLLQRGVDVEHIAEALKSGKPVAVCEQVLLKRTI